MFFDEHEGNHLKEIDSQLENVEASIKAALAKIDNITATNRQLIEEYGFEKIRTDSNLMTIYKDFAGERLSIRNTELKQLIDKENRLLDERKALTNRNPSPLSNQGNNDMDLILLTYTYLKSILTYSVCFHIDKIGMKKSQGHKPLTWEAEQNLIFNSFLYIAFWPLHLITSSDIGEKKTHRSRSTVTSYTYPSRLTYIVAADPSSSSSSPAATDLRQPNRGEGEGALFSCESEEKSTPSLKNKNI